MGHGERLSPFGSGEIWTISTSIAVSRVRVGGRRFCKDGCFFSSRHCRNGWGSGFPKAVLSSFGDGSVSCNGGERVGLLKGNRADRKEVFVS